MTKIIDAMGISLNPAHSGRTTSNPGFVTELPRIAKDSDGIDRIAIGDKINTNSIYAPAAMCIPGGWPLRSWRANFRGTTCAPAAMIHMPVSRTWTRRASDVSVLFPSIGIGFVAIKDPELSAAACRAYNNWMADFCRVAPDRLYSVAPVPLHDVEAAIVEMRRVVKEHSVKSVLVRSNPYNNRRLSDPAYDPFWAEAQELNCTIALHAAVTGDMPTAGFDRYHDFFQRMIISHPLEQQMACMDMICGGVLERFPRLESRSSKRAAAGLRTGWRGWTNSTTRSAIWSRRLS